MTARAGRYEQISSGQGGTGLGLVLAQKIAGLFGSTIKVCACCGVIHRVCLSCAAQHSTAQRSIALSRQVELKVEMVVAAHCSDSER